jgi:glycosyltransferase involved in cell wall biosynthesis
MVVDNGSRDGSVEAVRAAFPRVVVVALPENEGYAGGNNAGMREAMARGAGAVLLLNNDTQVAPDFLVPLLDTMNANPAVAAVSSGVLRVDNPTLLDVAYLDVYFGHGLVHRRGVNALPGDGFDVPKAVCAGVGCSLLVRTAALERVGLFDESYFAYHEEVDWCWRVRKHGLLVYYQPYSRVWHHGSKSTVALAKARTPRDSRPRAQLPNPIPLTWNPVRTYLGARNAVRFVRYHAWLPRKIYFGLSSLYALPLALLAIVMDREEEVMLGIWTYRRALGLYSAERHPGGGAAGRWLAFPADLFVALPRDIRRAHAAGHTAQLVEHLRGLWDGVRNRPLPLERLGLR